METVAFSLPAASSSTAAGAGDPHPRCHGAYDLGEGLIEIQLAPRRRYLLPNNRDWAL